MTECWAGGRLHDHQHDRLDDAVGPIAEKFTGVVHVPELVAAFWADGEVVVKELNECAAVVARCAVFDDVDAHTMSVPWGCGVELRYTPSAR
jgi:hypothetical protein